jgi:hypothetical protein
MRTPIFTFFSKIRQEVLDFYYKIKIRAKVSELSKITKCEWNEILRKKIFDQFLVLGLQTNFLFLLAIFGSF